MLLSPFKQVNNSFLSFSHLVVDCVSPTPRLIKSCVFSLCFSSIFAATACEEWWIDADNIILVGFSAGGNLALSAGIYFEKPASPTEVAPVKGK